MCDLLCVCSFQKALLFWVPTRFNDSRSINYGADMYIKVPCYLITFFRTSQKSINTNISVSNNYPSLSTFGYYLKRWRSNAMSLMPPDQQVEQYSPSMSMFSRFSDLQATFTSHLPHLEIQYKWVMDVAIAMRQNFRRSSTLGTHIYFVLLEVI